MKTLLSWSTGKDSAWTLHQLMQYNDVELAGLIVTINKKHQRVAMHGTSEALLNEQVKRLTLPLYPVYIPDPCTNEIYQQAMAELIDQVKKEGVEQIAFGDLFLEDIRNYRVKQLANTGIKPIFPLWQQPTKPLAQKMIDSGIKAVIACVDTKKLPAKFVGRDFDKTFLADLPKDVDPCGENGEFHTFVYDAPMFETPINIEVLGTHQSDQFVFADIVAVGRRLTPAK